MLTPRLEVSVSGLNVHAQRAQLERVFGHLVQNAIEACPAGGQVVVRLNAKDNCAIIEVSDSGCGMSEQFIRDNLFKPFESTKATGMGIGAYECREYVVQLGGQIDVISELAVGTTFCVRLPLRTSQASHAP